LSTPVVRLNLFLRQLQHKNKRRKQSNNNTKKKKCIFCDASSIASTARTDSYSHDHKASNNGINCCKCYQFSCQSCLRLIIKAVPTNTQSNKWLDQTTSYVDTGRIPPDFIGNCFMLVKEEVVRHPLNTPRKFDGYLVCHDYGLLISPSVNDMAVDCHGFGNDRNIKGLVHAVVTDDVAVMAAAENLVPDQQNCHLIHEKVIITKIKDLSSMLKYKEVCSLSI
jgi:hypothetical protein